MTPSEAANVLRGYLKNHDFPGVDRSKVGSMTDLAVLLKFTTCAGCDKWLFSARTLQRIIAASADVDELLERTQRAARAHSSENHIDEDPE